MSPSFGMPVSLVVIPVWLMGQQRDSKRRRLSVNPQTNTATGSRVFATICLDRSTRHETELHSLLISGGKKEQGFEELLYVSPPDGVQHQFLLTHRIR